MKLFSYFGFVFLLCFGLSAIFVGCSSDPSFEVASVNTPLSNTFGSLDDLARATVSAIEDSSEDELRKLMVTENEYRNVIWINMSTDEITSISVEKAYGWNMRDAQKAVNRALYDWGGKPWKFVSAKITKETRSFEKLSVLRGVEITVKDEKGELVYMNLLNVVVEMNGRYKVIAFDE